MTATTTLKKAKQWVLSGDFLCNRRLSILLWFGLPVVSIIHTLVKDSHINNFIIFRSVFYHSIQHLNLYNEYPLEYADVNLYGPIFSLLIAPFALLPVQLGFILWSLFNAWILYFAIRKLPIQKQWQNAVLIFSCNEMLNNTAWSQINPFILALLILGFVYAEKGKNSWALLFILLASFIKLYGIVGFAFFLFNEKKSLFIVWAVVWSVVLFLLPMLIAGPYFVTHSYADWYNAVAEKAAKNIRMDIHNDLQDISVMGMIKRIFNFPNFKTIWVLFFAVVMFAFQFIHVEYYKDLRFKLYILCSVCIAVVIFNTSSESPTYIIAFPMVCVWYLMQTPSKINNALFIFALVLTCFSYSDIFTPYVRTHIIRPYSLKALPCFLIWIVLSVQLYTKQFLQVDLSRERKNKPGLNDAA